MKVLKLISHRIFITSILLLAQLVWFIVFLIKLTSYSTIISVGFALLSLLMVLYIVVNDVNASVKISWIILIMALPLFGGLFYLLFGNKRPTKKMRTILNKEHERLRAHLQINPELLQRIKRHDERAFGTMHYLEEKTYHPIYENTQTQYFHVGETFYEALLKELKQATHFIFLEFFILEEGVMWDGIFDILVAKVKAGVDVRVMYDDVGSMFKLPAGFPQHLENHGIQCLPFNKFKPFFSLVMNHRDHRKIVVIDNHTAFTGGLNIADEYINVKEVYGHWKDTGIMLKGDAVWSFTLMFLEMWNAFVPNNDAITSFKARTPVSVKSDGYVQPFADSPTDHETVGKNIYIDLLAQAKHYVYIFTPYLIIDHDMQFALTMAAKRGVDVRIVTPGIADKKIIYRLTRSHYDVLLKAGVRIFEYTPGFLHAKSYVCDDELAIIGTINMDYRSLHLHFECGVLLYQNQSILDLKQDALDVFKVSREVSLDDRKQRMHTRLFDALLRLFAPLT